MTTHSHLSRRRFLGYALTACACTNRFVHGATPASGTPRPATPGFYTVDAQTPAGLRELFRPTSERLPLLSAHRGGAAKDLPENCLATYEATLRHAWSMLEIDLRATKDGHIMLMHDPTLDRTSNGTGRIQDRTLAELRELRLKDREGNLTNRRIPTLDEAIAWARGKTILIFDKKEVPVRDAVRKITEHKAESYAMVMAYSAKDITECHAANPDVMMEVMLGTPERFAEFERTGVPWDRIIAFVGHTQTPDVELCRRIRAKGASCMAGTSRNIDRQFLTRRVVTMDPLRADYEAVLAKGVDIIETDIPRELGPLLFDANSVPASKRKLFRAGNRR